MERLASTTTLRGKWEEHHLRSFYRAFHKHGVHWSKVAADVGPGVSAGQCEALHRHHQSFLSLPSQPQLETAFVAMVNDFTREDPQPQGRDGSQSNGTPDEQGDDGNDSQPESTEDVVGLAAQRARRTPKPTTRYDEELAQGTPKRHDTPKSAKSKGLARPPSPHLADWQSRKRGRKLFDPDVDQHHDDLGEGVDALLSLACHPPASSSRADMEPEDSQEGSKGRGMEEATPKRARTGTGRGVRATPSASGTPSVRGGHKAGRMGRGSGGKGFGGRGHKRDLKSPTSQPGTATSLSALGQEDGGAGSLMASPKSARRRRQQAAAEEAPVDLGAFEAGAAALGLPFGDLSQLPPQYMPTQEQLAAAMEAIANLASAAQQVLLGGDTADLLATGALPAEVPQIKTRTSGRQTRAARRAAGATAAPPRARAAKDEGGATFDAEAALLALQAAFPFYDPQTLLAAWPNLQAYTQMLGQQPGASGSGRGGGGAGGRRAVGRAEPPPRARRRKSRPEMLPPTTATLRHMFIMHRGAKTVAPPAKPEALASGAAPGSGGGEEAAAPGPSSDAPAAAAAAAGTGSDAAPSTLEAGPGTSAVATAAEQPLPDAGVVAAAAAAGPSSINRGSEGGGAGPAPGGKAAEAVHPLYQTLCNALSPRMRRWVTYEFHYSALDRPWFLRNELQDFALSLNLPTIQLTRTEWAVLRSALGKPRRLSLAFLQEERMRLEGYREHVRRKYDEVGAGAEVPPELPRPLRVGQRVTARHPVTRQLHNGHILTVKGSKYRVQFDRSELLTEVVRDVDVMPVDPTECLPLHMPELPVLLNGRSVAEQLIRSRVAVRTGLGVGGLPVLGWPNDGQQPALPADASLVAEVQRALEVKARLVTRLRQLNDEAAMGMHTDEQGGRSEDFQLQYTSVVLQLKETNTTLEHSLSKLHGRQQAVAAATSQHAIIVAQQAAALVNGGVRPSGRQGALHPPTGGAVGIATALAAQHGHHLLGPHGRPSPAFIACPYASSTQLVTQALDEARLVVEACRGRPGELPPAALPSLVQQQPGGSDAAAAGATANVDSAGANAAAQSDDKAAVLGRIAQAGAAPLSAAAAAGTLQSQAGAGQMLLALHMAAGEAVGGLQLPPDAGVIAAAVAAAAAGSSGSSAAGVVPELDEAQSEAWLKEIIVGSVGVLFTVQKCTSGGVPPTLIGEAMDLIIKGMRPKAQANDGLYNEIMVSVQGLKAYLTRAY